jgi:hypothetical protein
MKNEKLNKMLQQVETGNKHKISGIEVLEATQSMLVRGGIVDACPQCDNIGGIKPPPIPPTKKPLE